MVDVIPGGVWPERAAADLLARCTKILGHEPETSREIIYRGDGDGGTWYYYLCLMVPKLSADCLTAIFNAEMETYQMFGDELYVSIGPGCDGEE